MFILYCIILISFEVDITGKLTFTLECFFFHASNSSLDYTKKEKEKIEIDTFIVFVMCLCLFVQLKT